MSAFMFFASGYCQIFTVFPFFCVVLFLAMLNFSICLLICALIEVSSRAILSLCLSKLSYYSKMF